MRDLQALKDSDKNPTSFHGPINSISSTTLISMILDKLSGWKHEPRFVLFDIDGTVLQNFPRQLAILRQILIPTFPSLQNNAQVDTMFASSSHSYSIIPELKKYFTSSYQFSAMKKEFASHFLSNRFLHYDTFFPGVKQFFHFLLQNQINIKFITGRPEIMKEGTIKSLQTILPVEFDFHTSLVLKPSPEIDDFDYKERFIHANISDFSSQMLAYIDNEAPMCQIVKNILPESIVIHVNSSQAGSELFSGYTLDSWV